MKDFFASDGVLAPPPEDHELPRIDCNGKPDDLSRDPNLISGRVLDILQKKSGLRIAIDPSGSVSLSCSCIGDDVVTRIRGGTKCAVLF